MFRIAPHFRLQEWVAEEKGYFKTEGLAYEFRDNWGTASSTPTATRVAPSAVFAPPESPLRTPQDLKGVPISVGSLAERLRLLTSRLK